MAQTDDAARRELREAVIDNLIQAIPGFSASWWLLGNKTSHSHMGQVETTTGTYSFEFRKTHKSTVTQTEQFLGYTILLTPTEDKLWVWVYNPSGDADTNRDAILDDLRVLRRDHNRTTAQKKF